MLKLAVHKVSFRLLKVNFIALYNTATVICKHVTSLLNEIQAQKFNEIMNISIPARLLSSLVQIKGVKDTELILNFLHNLFQIYYNP